mgnify:CR=1 FL=1
MVFIYKNNIKFILILQKSIPEDFDGIKYEKGGETIFILPNQGAQRIWKSNIFQGICTRRGSG